MANFFDQFDEPKGNFFDQFDETPAGAYQAPEAPVTAGGLYNAADVGVQKSVAGLAGIPRAIGTLGAQGIQGATNFISNQLGLTPEQRQTMGGVDLATRDLTKDGLVRLPTSQEALATIRQNFGGQDYTPQNKYERAAETVGEFAPNALFPGGVASRVLSVAAPATTVSATREAGGGDTAQLLAALGGGMAGSKVANVLERATASPLPTFKAMGELADKQYGAIDQLATAQTMPKGSVPNLVDSIEQSLHVQNFRSANAPDTYKALSELRAGTKGQPHDVGDLLNARRALGKIKGEDGVAAGVARDMITSIIDARTPGMGAMLKTADQNYNAYKVAQELNSKFQKAEIANAPAHSGLNLGNKLRAAAASLANDARRTRFMTDAEKQRLVDLSNGTLTQNALRYTGNLLGGGGGLGATVAAGLGGHYLGGYEGGAGGAIGTALTGLALRRAYNRSVANQARGLAQQALSRAPAAAGATYIPPQGLLGSFGRGGLPAGGLLGIQ